MMSFVVFGGLILFAIYAMVHFMHEWLDSRKRHQTQSDQNPDDAGDQA